MPLVHRHGSPSVLAFYPLKYVSFFTSPWTPLLTGRISRSLDVGARLWNARASGVYPLLMWAGSAGVVREGGGGIGEGG